MTNKEFLVKLGLEIKVSRIRKGLTVKQVAKSTGLALDTIWHIERGTKDGHIISYKRIADALEMEMKNIM